VGVVRQRPQSSRLALGEKIIHRSIVPQPASVSASASRLSGSDQRQHQRHRPRDAGATTPAQRLALFGACRARHCACEALPASRRVDKTRARCLALISPRNGGWHRSHRVPRGAGSGSPRCEAGRRRPIGAVAAPPVTLARPRRWATLGRPRHQPRWTRRPAFRDATSRPFRKRQAPPLPHRLRFREGGGCPPQNPLSLSPLTSRKRNHRLAALRRRLCHDLASPPPETLMRRIVGASIPACPSVSQRSLPSPARRGRYKSRAASTALSTVLHLGPDLVFPSRLPGSAPLDSDRRDVPQRRTLIKDGTSVQGQSRVLEKIRRPGHRGGDLPSHRTPDASLAVTSIS
jgi:hypothetical protein